MARSEANCTPATYTNKPAKPYPEFPLFAHAAGVWAKKIRGNLHYLGPWDDPDGALNKYLEQKEDLHAGRAPRLNPEALTVKEAVNTFLDEKKHRVRGGGLSARTWDEYKEACDTIIAAYGKTRLVSDLRPEDFTALRRRMAKRWGPARLGKMITCVRCVFKFAYEAARLNDPQDPIPAVDRGTDPTAWCLELP